MGEGAAGLRNTKQRLAVVESLESSVEFVSAQQLHARLRANGDSVGLSTVYRTLQALAAAGTIDMLLRDDGEAVYRRCSTGHHHHLVCRACGRTVEVEGAAVERWAERVAQDNGFTQVTHTLEIFGVCGSCSPA